MKRRKFTVPVVASLLSLTLCMSGGPTFAAAKNHVQLTESIPLAAKLGKLINHTNRATKASLTVALQLRNNDKLNDLIASLNDPASPNYKHYLTPDEFKNQYGPTNATVADVKSYLTSQGFKIKDVSSNNAFINVSGTTGQMEDTFGVKINNYKNSKGQTFYSNDQAPAIPAKFLGVIKDVEGLNNEPHYTHPTIRKASAAAAAPRVGSGPSGGFTPDELKAAYDISPLASAGYTGAGQTIALMELDGYQASNIDYYNSYYGLGSPAPINVYVDGYNGAAGAGQLEVEMDIEILNAIAPKAQVIVYEGPNTNQGLIDTYQKIATDNIAKSISVSWGIGEQHESAAMMNSLHTIFQQYAAQGQSIFAASGDNGAYDSGGFTLEVDSPANDPYVTGVGGTHLDLSGSSYGFESVWNYRTLFYRNGSGGGLSKVYARPSYQAGPGVLNSYSNGKRQVPDVSANADPNSGYSIFSKGAWTAVGGTSLAAPLWAAVAALNNQYAAAHGKGILGEANPALYRVFNSAQNYPAYHDITSGNNLYYPATAGYDMASGIGTPDVYNLIRDINETSDSSNSGGNDTGDDSGDTGGTGGPGSPGGTVVGELIQNGGFENGQSPWIESSTGNYQMVDPSFPHSGSYSAYLNGYNSSNEIIYQTVTIPSSATNATLTFWTYVSTSERSHPYDYFYVKVRNNSGSALSTLLTLNDGTASGWVRHSFDLTKYKGQTIQIAFNGTNDSSYPTNFYVDEVSLQVQ